MSGPTIAYAGMTHLGLCSAVAAASKGFQTIAFSPDRGLVDALGNGRLPVSEPGLDDLVRTHRGRLHFTADPQRLATADVVYVAPDVATDDTGASDLRPLESLLELVLAHTGPRTVVVILSQVEPGFTRAHLRQGRSIYYQVETLIFGRAVERATLPERFIVGCADPVQPLDSALAAFLGAFGCPILPMRLESAELAKISINFCLVASVSVANTLAEVCERIGADWSEIVPALRLDRRIGPHAYLAPGLGIAGGNLERDLATVLRIARAHPIDTGVVEAWIANSRHRKDWTARVVTDELLARNPDARIAVLGLAYKENTHSTKNSPALACLKALEGHDLAVFDPVVKGDVVPFARAAVSALDCAAQADALMVLTPWPEFRAIAVADLAAVMRGRLVIDPYRLLDTEALLAAGFDYITLGVPPRRAKGRDNA
ncbi:MAG: hypothetical protein RL477_730 [Pseudomonadota bacterium]|jgi:UDPglucose 6-dehydrogenase